MNEAEPLRLPAAKSPVSAQRPSSRRQASQLTDAGVDVQGAQVEGHDVAEGAGAAVRAALAAAAAYRRALGAVGDVLALGEHGRRERHDLVEGRLGGLGHGLGRLAGPDPGLDVARAECAVHLYLQLAEACVLTAQGGPEPSVDVKGELDSLVTDEQQALAVIAQSCEREVRHLLSCSSPAVCPVRRAYASGTPRRGSQHGAPW